MPFDLNADKTHDVYCVKCDKYFKVPIMELQCPKCGTNLKLVIKSLISGEDISKMNYKLIKED